MEIFLPYLVSVFLLLVIFSLRKSFSQYFLTPTGFLSLTWIVFLVLKGIFASDFFFSINASMLFVLFIGSFFIGELFIHFYISGNRKSVVSRYINQFNFGIQQRKFKEFKSRRNFEFFIVIFGILSFLGSILYLWAFMNYFGSLMGLLSAGWAVRGASGEIMVNIFTRSILLLCYSAIVLTLVYSMCYGKFKWFFLLPYLSILIMGITQAGRAGFFMIIFQVFITSYWRSIYENVDNKRFNIDLSSSPELKLIKSIFGLVSFTIVIFVLGGMLRSQEFSLNFDLISEGVLSFKSYLFGGIASFTSYLDTKGFVDLGWGRYSFSSLYGLLGIQENINGIYTDFLPISMKDNSLDTNIFTAFRQLMDDFGVLGTVIFMFWIGALSSIIFERSIKGDIKAIAVLIVLYTFLFHTPLLAITCHNSVLISGILPTVVLSLTSKNIIR
jgi:oligosaccharide repeat unit polymerase